MKTEQFTHSSNRIKSKTNRMDSLLFDTSITLTLCHSDLVSLSLCLFFSQLFYPLTFFLSFSLPSFRRLLAFASFFCHSSDWVASFSPLFFLSRDRFFSTPVTSNKTYNTIDTISMQLLQHFAWVKCFHQLVTRRYFSTRDKAIRHLTGRGVFSFLFFLFSLSFFSYRDSLYFFALSFTFRRLFAFSLLSRYVTHPQSRR